MINGYGMGGWDWYWMLPMMVFWITVLGIVVYGAVRLAQRHEHHPTQ